MGGAPVSVLSALLSATSGVIPDVTVAREGCKFTSGFPGTGSDAGITPRSGKNMSLLGLSDFF